jgi:hypothetical protein
VRDRRRTWQVIGFLALLIAARGGNWLISRASIGASTFQFAATWFQIAAGSAVAYWAWRRARIPKPEQPSN